jgi:membrane dipeptidase
MVAQRRRRPALTPEEARALHYEALVIDTQQPPITTGMLFTERMRRVVEEHARQGRSRVEVAPLLEAMAAREIQTSPDAREAYLAMWERSGVTVACGTYSGAGRLGEAFERAVRRIAQAQAIVDALRDKLVLVRRAADIEQAHAEGKHGIVVDFQDTIAFGDDLERIECFYHLGLRMVQLTYNLQNLVGDGCTERYQGGLTYFGREVVRRLNELGILVDISHCSEQVGWDALEVSTAPVVVSHSASKAVARHDRGKSDELARAVAERGGYFGVVVVPGFISERPEATLEDFVRHVEHLVDVCGIDHVGIGTDKMGPPSSRTGSLIEYPPSMPVNPPGAFDWAGFRPEEHRLTSNYRLAGYETFADWPNLTVALAQAGFTEEELRKLLGRNFLRVFREVVG